MCAVYEGGIDPQRPSFPSTAVATRQAMAQRESQSTKNVCAAQAQSRDLNCCGLEKQVPKSSLTNIAVNST